MLFTIITTGLKGRSFAKNPGEFVKDGVKETALSFLIFPIVLAIVILAFLFILSFTHLLGGPYLLAKIFFWILFIGYAIASIPIYAFYKLIKKTSQEAGETTEKIFVKSGVKE
jgi:glucan phosphoethanolaminetransferase (alkaline phosphatase superfamily)